MCGLALCREELRVGHHGLPSALSHGDQPLEMLLCRFKKCLFVLCGPRGLVNTPPSQLPEVGDLGFSPLRWKQWKLGY